MPFEQDVAFAEQVGQAYGKYHSTFWSQTGQVVAQLFEQNGRLIAHVSFPKDVNPEEVVDAYWSELKQYAKDHGFENKLKVIYSE
ncbi:MAG: hypothetical protein JWL69_4281 [Phycisphaerales bacterium]|nr:hypothetical protein [Phycisphaerales bacterium]MDB5354455.1 hypothetical protein [Phycisphaerales bacterium]